MILSPREVRREEGENSHLLPESRHSPAQELPSFPALHGKPPPGVPGGKFAPVHHAARQPGHLGPQNPAPLGLTPPCLPSCRQASVLDPARDNLCTRKDVMQGMGPFQRETEFFGKAVISKGGLQDDSDKLCSSEVKAPFGVSGEGFDCSIRVPMK